MQARDANTFWTEPVVTGRSCRNLTVILQARSQPSGRNGTFIMFSHCSAAPSVKSDASSGKRRLTTRTPCLTKDPRLRDWLLVHYSGSYKRTGGSTFAVLGPHWCYRLGNSLSPLFFPGMVHPSSISTSWRQRQSQWEDGWWKNHSFATSSGVFQISPGCRPSVRLSISVGGSKFSETLWLQLSPFCRWYFLVSVPTPKCRLVGYSAQHPPAAARSGQTWHRGAEGTVWHSRLALTTSSSFSASGRIVRAPVD